jgi:uncharacterized membrane protein
MSLSGIVQSECGGLAMRGPAYTIGKATRAMTVALSITVSAVSAHGQCQYEVELIRAPEIPGFSFPPTLGKAVNEQGHVVGYHCGFACQTDYAFLWTPEEGFQTLPFPPGATSAQAYDINDHDVIIGASNIGGYRGFIYDHGEWTDLPPAPGGAWNDPHAINNANVVVGKRSTGDGVNPLEAYIWSEQSGFIDLEGMSEWGSWAGGVNDNDVVVGRHGIWQDGRLSFLGPIPGGVSSIAADINSRGQIAVTGSVPDGDDGFFARCFIWHEGEWTALPLLPEYEGTVGQSINDRGQIVGRVVRYDPQTEILPVLWVDGRIFDLNDLIPPGAAEELYRAFDINNRGQIIVEGNPIEPGSKAAFLLTPIDPPLGDLDGDCDVDHSDLTFLLDLWATPDPIADLNGDGVVNVFDLLLLLRDWR